MKTSKPLSLILSVLTGLLLVSASIAVPLLCRPFYYAHIQPLGLESTGLTVEQIKECYDQVMDYCLGFQGEFSAGVLWFSASGADHFADVRALFLLDLWVLGLSLVLLMAMFLYCRNRQVRPHCFRGRGPGFWAAAGLGVLFLAVGGLAALDFDRAFTIFHAIFFPGKDNWIFYWKEDPVILLLPQEFFRNCAILILALLLIWCAVLIAADFWAGKQRQKRMEQQNPPQGGCPGCSGL